MLLLVGYFHLTVSGHDLGGKQVVDRQAVGSGQVADPAAESQPTDTRRRNDPAGGGQAMDVGGVVELAPCGSSAGTRPASLRVHLDAAEQRKVDDHAAVVGTKPGCAVPASPYRQFQTAVASKIDGIDDVGHLLRLGR